MRRALINTGAGFLIATIALFMLLMPALRSTRDPGRDQMRDIPAFQRARDREDAYRERPLLFLTGLCCGAGLACLAIGLKCPRGQ